MAEALVGGAFVSAALQVLFDRLASREVLDFLSSSKDIDQLLNMLKIKLLSANSVLDDAEIKQASKPAIKRWLDELKYVVYHAEDLLDEIATEALCQNMEACSQSRKIHASKIFMSPTSTFDKVISGKIKNIMRKLDFITKEKDVLGLKDDPGYKNTLSRFPTTSLVDCSGIYGRDKDKEDIVNLVLSDEVRGSKISVIPIVGMGGVGKTTLAQIVYNDSRVDQRFDLKAWIYVSEEFSVSRITKEILEAFNSRTESTNLENLDQLQFKLKGILMGKKFLIVMDDVWSKDYKFWELLLAPLNFGGQGSKIVTTSRSKTVASIIGTVPIRFLKQLSDDDCWLVFAKHAYSSGNFSHPHQEAIGRNIAKRCQGLPLAAKALGNLLRTKFAPSDWKKMYESDIWELFDGDTDVIPSLRISYSYLPSHLKRCFAYCSIFPRKFEFEKELLVQLWMAENLLLQAEEHKSLEEIGDEYFRDLVSMSFFQESGSTQQSFVMHDLIHDLAKCVAGEFVASLGQECKRSVSRKTRHVSFFASHGSRKILSLGKAESLRTILQLDINGAYGQYSSLDAIGNLSWLPLTQLRVLSCHICLIDQPTIIGDLRYLRYLDLSFSPIQKLPDSFSKLYNLQVLKLNSTDLVELPKDMHRLINLRHLDIRNTKLKEMPIQMGKLARMQTLTCFFVGKYSGSGISELGALQLLRGTLYILQLQNVKSPDDAMRANLPQKNGLEELVLQWGDGTNDTQRERYILHELEPNENLKDLTIDGYGGTSFPSWLGYSSFSNLVNLHIRNCHYCFSLPSFGQLPSLKSLYICQFNQLENVDSEFYGNNQPFRCLEVLEFRGLPMWKQWIQHNYDDILVFPCLRKLHIVDCCRLINDLPCEIPFLTDLKIENCPQLIARIPKLPAVCEVIIKTSDMDWNYFWNSSGAQPDFTSLKSLRIYSCPRFVSFSGGLLAPNLRELSLNRCSHLRSLPESMHMLLPSLEYLLISDCPVLESFPEGGLPSSLKRLAILGSESLVANILDWNLQRLPSLKCFEIANQAQATELFPEEGLLPSSLITLEINKCSNLISLGNGGISRLPALQDLCIRDCPKLKSLPEDDLPISMCVLQLSNCPLLKQRYERDEGEGWMAIAHIPCIRIDDKIITSSSDCTHVEEEWSGQEWSKKKNKGNMTVLRLNKEYMSSAF